LPRRWPSDRPRAQCSEGTRRIPANARADRSGIRTVLHHGRQRRLSHQHPDETRANRRGRGRVRRGKRVTGGFSECRAPPEKRRAPMKKTQAPAKKEPCEALWSVERSSPYPALGREASWSGLEESRVVSKTKLVSCSDPVRRRRRQVTRRGRVFDALRRD